MKQKATFCAVVIALAVMLGGAAPGGPPSKTMYLNLSGSLDGRFTFLPYDAGDWDFLTIGQAEGDVRGMGSAKVYSTHQPHADGTLTSGEFRIVADRGDALYGTFEGAVSAISSDQALGQVTLSIVGGTGRYTHASGTLSGEFLETFDDPGWSSAGVSWDIQGVISYTKPSGAETIAFFNLAEPSSFTIGGGRAAYWGLAPLSGIPSIQSQFVQGGSQAGTIFYGSFAKESDSAPAATMTIALPDLSDYRNVRVTVALAAFPGIWETTHRDSLRMIGRLEGEPVPVVDCSNANGCFPVPGTIDTFLPPYYGASLRSQVHGADLVFEFQDLQYAIDNNLRSLTFAFASTDYPELAGIDSVKITGEPVRKKR